MIRLINPKKYERNKFEGMTPKQIENVRKDIIEGVKVCDLETLRVMLYVKEAFMDE